MTGQARYTLGANRPGGITPRPPSLEPEWQRWLAENLLLGADPQAIQRELVAKGCPPAIARAEVAAAQDSPYFKASAVLQARLAKRDWLLRLVEHHAALDEDAPTEVARRDRLPAETFLAEHYAPQRPVVLTGLIDHWPAMTRWSLDHFANLPGDPEIEVQSGRESDADYEINCRDHSRRMPLSTVLAKLARDVATNDFYVTANNGGHNRTALTPLWEEIGDLPGYLVPREGQDGFFWMGPRGTVTPWHHDLTNNLLAQIRGRKQVTLVSPSQTALMRNHRHCYSLFGGDATFAAAPARERPRTMTCTLEPGDILFIPVGWWHHIVGLEMTIGLSFINLAWDNEVFRGYTTYHHVSSLALILPLSGALVGAVIGSFIGALTLRWPAGRSIATGRSACDGCGATLRAWELVPLASYLALRGRCARCGSAINPCQPIAELGGLCVGAAAMAVVPGWPGLAGALFGWALLALALLDAGHFWLPDKITLPLAAAGLALGLGDITDRLVGLGVGWLSLTLVSLAYARARGRVGLGAGDAKLFAAIGAWLGWRDLPTVLLIASIAGLAWALTARLRGEAISAVTRLPFGTLLALAAFPLWLPHA